MKFARPLSTQPAYLSLRYLKERLLQICKIAKAMQDSEGKEDGSVGKSDPICAGETKYPWTKTTAQDDSGDSPLVASSSSAA